MAKLEEMKPKVVRLEVVGVAVSYESVNHAQNPISKRGKINTTGTQKRRVS